MESLSPEVLAFLVVAGFLSAFIDSVVGGGGMISLPALLLTGLPPSLALGTNKMASVMGSLTSTLSFMRSGKINYGLIKYLFPLSLIGSVFGVITVQKMPPEFLKPLVIVLLIAVTIYSVFKKDWGNESTYQGMTRKVAVLSGVAAFTLGFYDGFFGPGAGSFLIFAFLMIGFDFVTAAGNARTLNFASNIAAVITFGLAGSINFYYSIPMGLAMIVGALAGTRLAITKGATYVRPLFITVTTLLVSKQLWDLLR
ncbi:putative membrane transporter protein YfcA [bioreactor metagenome]|uniref:Putative membrane transporter protein YfcA n=1 Tax=bioreactor metagenome TaxID=1076179 RepID=A0A645FSW4_9ZZZZ